jgi:hypothetical protein
MGTTGRERTHPRYGGGGVSSATGPVSDHPSPGAPGARPYPSAVPTRCPISAAITTPSAMKPDAHRIPRDAGGYYFAVLWLPPWLQVTLSTTCQSCFGDQLSWLLRSCSRAALAAFADI